MINIGATGSRIRILEIRCSLWEVLFCYLIIIISIIIIILITIAIATMINIAGP